MKSNGFFLTVTAAILACCGHPAHLTAQEGGQVRTLDLQYKLASPAARYLIANAEGFGKAKLEVRAPEGEQAEALAIEYTFDAPDQTGVLLGLWNVQVPILNATIPMPFQAIRLDVYGDGSGNPLRMEFADDLRREFCYNFGPIEWKGWKTLTVPMPSEVRPITFVDAFGVWIGKQSHRDMTDPQPGWQQRMDADWPTDIPAGPLSLKFIGLIQACDAQGGAGNPSSGTIFFRNLAADLPADSLDGLEITALNIYRPGNLFRGHVNTNDTIGVNNADRPGGRSVGENGNCVELCLTNNSTKHLEFIATTACKDLYGKIVEGPSRPLSIGPGMSIRRFLYLPEGLPNGWYETVVTLSAEGAMPRRASIAMGKIGDNPLPMKQTNGFFGMSMGVLDQGFHMLSPVDYGVAELADVLGVMSYRAYDWFPDGGVKKVATNAQYKFSKMYDKDCVSVLWPWEEMDPNYFPAHIKAYEDYARVYGEYYGDRARFYQNQNEPLSYYGYGPTFAAQRLGPFHKAIHAGWANAVVIGPNIHVNVPLDTSVGLKWLDEYFQKGGLDYVDRLGIMPLRFLNWGPRASYPEKKDEEALAYQKLLNEELAKPFPLAHAVDALPILYDLLVEKMKQHGGVKPIHLSEVGLPGVAFLTPGTQAKLASKTILHSLAHPAVGSMVWRKLLGGLMGYDADNIVDDTPGKNFAVTPAAMAYAILATELGDVKCEAETILRDDEAGTFVYKFTGPRGDVVAAWSNTPGVKIGVTGGHHTLDIMGRVIGSSEVGRELTEFPILIRGAKKLSVRADESE